MINKTSGSIANKLTLLFTCATLCIVGITLIVSYIILVKVISTAEKQYMIDEVYILKDALKRNSSNISALNQEVNGVPAALKKDASFHYYIKLKNEHGKTVMMTPDMEIDLNKAPIPEFDRTKN